VGTTVKSHSLRSQVRHQVWEYIEKHGAGLYSVTELARLTGANSQTVSNAILDLRSHGLTPTSKRGVYEFNPVIVRHVDEPTPATEVPPCTRSDQFPENDTRNVKNGDVFEVNGFDKHGFPRLKGTDGNTHFVLLRMSLSDLLVETWSMKGQIDSLRNSLRKLVADK
jgi:hypothetical protein